MADMSILPNELGITLGVGTIVNGTGGGGTGGGVEYTAGEGIWIKNHVINADVTQSELDGKAAVDHKHAMADVTGLQAALDAKASTGTATTDAAGLMSAADKAKLDGIAEGADKSDAYTKAEVDERLTGYLKSADAEATYAPASDVSALGTRMDDAESSIAHLAGRLPIYYYNSVPSESSITEKPQLAVIKGGAVYLFE